MPSVRRESLSAALITPNWRSMLTSRMATPPPVNEITGGRHSIVDMLPDHDPRVPVVTSDGGLVKQGEL